MMTNPIGDLTNITHSAQADIEMLLLGGAPTQNTRAALMSIFFDGKPATAIVLVHKNNHDDSAFIEPLFLHIKDDQELLDRITDHVGDKPTLS